MRGASSQTGWGNRGAASVRVASSCLENVRSARIVRFLAYSINPRIIADMATEASIFFYAFASWGRKPFVPEGARGFSYHRRNASVATLYTVFFASLVELVAVHLLLRTVAPRADIALLVVSAFGAIWILGFVRSVQLLPILVTDDSLQVRMGLIWRLDIPRTAIESIDFGRVNAPPKRTPGYLRAALGEPNVLVTLRAPLRAHGSYGIVRDVTRVGLVIDDLKEFEREMTIASLTAPRESLL